MRREEAVGTDRIWAGVVHTEPGAVSAWHHHGEHDSVIHVLTGAFRMEFGSRGEHALLAGPGDFLFVPARAIHRESNPSSETCTAVVVRSGSGQAVWNVPGPSAAGD
jgi:uncharacterized RmlC-like cupin family protein